MKTHLSTPTFSGQIAYDPAITFDSSRMDHTLTVAGARAREAVEENTESVAGDGQDYFINVVQQDGSQKISAGIFIGGNFQKAKKITHYQGMFHRRETPEQFVLRTIEKARKLAPKANA